MNRKQWMLLLSKSLLFVLPACGDKDPGDETGTDTGDDTGDDPGACEQTYEGHATCNADNGDMFFCGDDGDCSEASGCASLECCLPGRGGDEWCAANFGEDSVCAVVNNDGECS